MATEQEFLISALQEANDALQEELSRLRNSNKICRTIIRQLRETVRSLQAQVELAKFNDELFKDFCNGSFDASVVTASEGGLPEQAGTVESAAIDAGEASAPTTSS